MGKFLLSWVLLKWISCSKGEGMSHGSLCSFPQSLPPHSSQCSRAVSPPMATPRTILKCRSCCLAPGCPESSQGAPVPLRKDCQQSRTSADRVCMVWQRQQSQTLPAEAPLVLWQQAEADESYSCLCQDISSSVRELGLLHCPNQGPKCCQLPNHATKKRKGLFPACCY